MTVCQFCEKKLYVEYALGEQFWVDGRGDDLCEAQTEGVDKFRHVAVEPEAYARRTDPETSHAAAASLTPERLRRSQEQVLGVLTVDGMMTDERLVEIVHDDRRLMSPSGCRTRRKELVDLGLVVDSGLRKATDAGRASIVWKVAEERRPG